MMKKEDVFETLTALSGIYGAGSFGYLPLLFAAKWLVDNPSSKEFLDLKEKYPHISVSDGLKRIAFLLFPYTHLAVYSWEVSRGEMPHFRLDISVSPEDAEKIISYTSKALSSLNLSEANVSRKTLLEGFDMYLESCLAETRIDVSVQPGAVERIVAGIAADGVKVSDVYDPFCRFGALLSAVSAERKTAGDEMLLYSSVAYVRSLFAGSAVDVLEKGSIEDPLLSDAGMLKQFPLVVSDLSGVYSDKTSSVFQMDIHKRFSALSEESDMLTPAAAFCHAFACTSPGGRCIVVAGNEGYFRAGGIFGNMSFSGSAEFVLEDYLEAVIDVAVPPRFFGRSARRFRDLVDSRKIYVFSRRKDAARRGKILFVNAAELPADEEVVSKVVSCVKGFTEIPGFSKVVDSKDVIGRHELKLDAVQFTAVLEAPKSEDLCRIVRDLKRLEGERISLMKDIEAVSAELSVKRG